VDWNCPVCGSATARVFCVRGEFPIRACSACRHRFAEWQPPPEHVGETYGDSYFFGGGAGYPDYLTEGPLLRARGRSYARLIRRYVERGAMLDVGAAAGFICDGFRAEGWNPEALEPNPAMAAHGRDKLNLAVHAGTLEDFPASRTYDLISMIEVAAHFTDLRRAFTRAAALTRAGGFWLIETWNNQSFTARAFGRHWHEYNPPSVLHYFSCESLERLAADFGFQRVASGRPGKRIAWRHARSLLDHQLSLRWFRHMSRLIPDDTIFPYPAEDLFWMLLQKRADA